MKKNRLSRMVLVFKAKAMNNSSDKFLGQNPQVSGLNIDMKGVLALPQNHFSSFGDSFWRQWVPAEGRTLEETTVHF